MYRHRSERRLRIAGFASGAALGLSLMMRGKSEVTVGASKESGSHMPSTIGLISTLSGDAKNRWTRTSDVKINQLGRDESSAANPDGVPARPQCHIHGPVHPRVRCGCA